MAIKLRPYQVDAIKEVFESFRINETNVILNMPPGAGKTETAISIITKCIEAGFPVVFCVRSRELVKNASRRFDKYGINHSVFMAGSHKYSASKLIQVCSADTLTARKSFPFSDRECLLILDEQHKDYSKVIDNYPRGFILGLSGTPYNVEMNKYFHRVISPIQAYELRDSGYLVDFVTYCPNIMSTKDISIKRGDFDKKQLESVVTESAVVGNVVSDWIKYGQDRPTVCFAVSVAHSQMLANEFKRAGISAVHCDANSTEQEREHARIGLENGSVKVVCNVDIFSVGWDCPAVSCIIQARPTWSLIWYLQALGRGNRSMDGKENCIVIDSAGNVFRHGLFYEVRDIDLTKKEKKQYKEKDNITNCEACFMIFDSKFRTCPHCGHQKPVKERKLNLKEGELSMYNEDPHERRSRLIRECRLHFKNCEWVRRRKGIKNPSFSIDSCIKKFGEEIVNAMNAR